MHPITKFARGVSGTACLRCAASESAGKAFRIGHVGDMNDASMLGAIAGVEIPALSDCGFEINGNGAQRLSNTIVQQRKNK